MNDKQTPFEVIIGQVTSGRWLMTVAAAICLIHFSWSFPPEKLDKIIDIIKDIVIFYFVVRDVSKPQGGTNAPISNPNPTIIASASAGTDNANGPATPK